MSYAIIYQTLEGLQTDFEFIFNESVLFNNIPHYNVFDGGKMHYVKDNSVIVYSSNRLRIRQEFINYLRTIRNYTLFHCSNEGLNHFTKYYKKANAVLRSGGWNPNIRKPNVYSVPLAFQSEFYNPNPESVCLDNRKYAWCFFGSLKGDRAEMYECFKSIEPFFHFQSKGWMDSDNKTPEQVIEYYKDMIFIPSPSGNIYFECNRTLDALEWGCIPVTTCFLGEDCYKYIYGDHPFIVGKDWQDAADQVRKLLNEPAMLKEKQLEVWTWYRLFKNELARDIAYILKGDFDKITGKQFQYQRQSRNNWKLRWRFFKHFTAEVYTTRLLQSVLLRKREP